MKPSLIAVRCSSLLLSSFANETSSACMVLTLFLSAFPLDWEDHRDGASRGLTGSKQGRVLVTSLNWWEKKGACGVKTEVQMTEGPQGSSVRHPEKKCLPASLVQVGLSEHSPAAIATSSCISRWGWQKEMRSLQRGPNPRKSGFQWWSGLDLDQLGGSKFGVGWGL